MARTAVTISSRVSSLCILQALCLRDANALKFFKSCEFAGKDASRAFIKGDFTEAGLTSDVSDFSYSQIVALHDWLSFYQREYTAVGWYLTMMLLICSC